MSETVTEQAGSGKQGVLARKLAATKEGAGAIKSSHTLKALRRSLARAAAELCELPLAVLAARQSNRAPEDFAEILSDKHLLVVLDGPNGKLGAATMDAATVTALIQKQTIGQVMGKAPAERNYTPTDAAMTAEFLEKAFGKVVDMLEGQTDQIIFSGYRFGAQIEDVRSLALGLEAEDYRLISLKLDLAIGAMQGEMNLILPEPTPEDLGLGGGVGPSLGRNMGGLRAELSAVLCKLKVPLQEFSSLKAGDVLPLDQAFLYETDLLSIGGQTIAQGRLGQMNGSRAVRLNVPKTKLVNDADHDGLSFSTRVGSEPPALPAEPPVLDLGIAAQDLQDPMDSPMGMPDLGGGLGADFGADFESEFGADLGSDLGSGLDLGAAPLGNLPALGSPMDESGGTAVPLGLDNMGLDPLPGGIDQFNPDDGKRRLGSTSISA